METEPQKPSLQNTTGKTLSVQEVCLLDLFLDILRYLDFCTVEISPHPPASVAYIGPSSESLRELGDVMTKLERLGEDGKVPLHELALEHPVLAWRIWTRTYPRDYNEQSTVCTPAPVVPAASGVHGRASCITMAARPQSLVPIV